MTRNLELRITRTDILTENKKVNKVMMTTMMILQLIAPTTETPPLHKMWWSANYKNKQESLIHGSY